MQEINFDSWERKEHFSFFHRMDYPVYNITFEMDVTELKKYSKRHGLSFHYSLIYLSTISANEIENFRYRIRGEKIVLHDRLHPSFADLVKGSDLFKLVTVDLVGGIKDFNETATIASMNQKEYLPVDNLKDRDDFIFFSALPWISFTAIDHTMNFNRDDAIPRISWGRYYENNDRLVLPYNLRVNHCFVDGFHLGLFKEIMERNMKELNES